MKRCNSNFKIDFPTAGYINILCLLEKDHKGKHKFEGKSEGKLFKVEWWDELPIIEGLSEMYVKDGML